MDSDDDIIFNDMEIIEDARNLCRKLKKYQDRKNPFEYYDEKDFKDLYRFDKETARMIVDLVRNDIGRTLSRRGIPIPLETMVMSTIRYIAKGSYQKDIGGIHGISQQSMSFIIKKVVAALARQMKKFIDFPVDRQSLHKLKTDFFEMYGFPQCIGAIDCTHIKIKNPGGELGGRYRCRKGFYSLNVQVICDANCKILDIVARWRGSVHDSRIWRESAIKSKLENEDLKGGVLIGDSGYGCSKILLTPFRISATLSPAERLYNTRHIQTKNTVERLFGQLKNKFRICMSGMNIDLNTSKNMIIAIAVLHNIAKERNTFFAADETPYENEDEVEENSEEESTTNHYRQRFINKYFS